MNTEEHNLLGIYINQRAASVVCLTPKHKLIDCFEVTIAAENDEEKRQENTFPQLAELINKKCSEKGLSYNSVSVGVDCSMYTQHNITSEFTDYKQIASTIRFDTEGAIATDISDYVLAFSRKDSEDGTGSDLQVYTVKKQQLGDIIKALQKTNMDPVMVQPDVMLISEFIKEKILEKTENTTQTLFITVSRQHAYFTSYDENGEELFTRTILLGGGEENTELLATQIPLTLARISEQSQINSVKAIGEDIDTSELSEKTGVEVGKLTISEFIEEKEEGKTSECPDKASLLTAFGAAMANPRKKSGLNFRNDYMPYQGRKRKIEKLARALSIAATSIIIILGVYLIFDLVQKSSLVGQLNQKFSKDYSTVMMGEQIPESSSRAADELARELRRIRSVKSGQLSTTGEKSVSAKLTILLEAFNKSAKATNLKIESINITSRSINIVGNTSSRASTLKLMESLKSTRLEVTKTRLETEDNRDRFSISLEV